MTEKKGSSPLRAAVAGGVIGSLLTAALFVFAIPQYFSGRIVRQGMLSDPQILVETADALRDAPPRPTGGRWWRPRTRGGASRAPG